MPRAQGVGRYLKTVMNYLGRVPTHLRLSYRQPLELHRLQLPRVIHRRHHQPQFCRRDRCRSPLPRPTHTGVAAHLVLPPHRFLTAALLPASLQSSGVQVMPDFLLKFEEMKIRLKYKVHIAPRLRVLPAGLKRSPFCICSPRCAFAPRSS